MDTKKIILVTLSPKTHRTSEENLGLEYLKSCLVEKKYDVKIIDAWLNELDVKTKHAEHSLISNMQNYRQSGDSHEN